jgi:hypothetical protein
MELKPKDEIMTLMIEVFEMIEALNIPEGKYLEFADKFKEMNINLGRLQQVQQIIIENVYYQRYVRNRPTINKKRLTQAQKAKHPNYLLCSCGDYIHKDEEANHIKNTLKHRTGLRNRKYASKQGANVDFEINREVLLHGFTIGHICKQKGINPDITPEL